MVVCSGRKAGRGAPARRAAAVSMSRRPSGASRAPAMSRPVSGSRTSPTALTTITAPTVTPARSATAAPRAPPLAARAGPPAHLGGLDAAEGDLSPELESPRGPGPHEGEGLGGQRLVAKRRRGGQREGGGLPARGGLEEQSHLAETSRRSLARGPGEGLLDGPVHDGGLALGLDPIGHHAPAVLS